MHTPVQPGTVVEVRGRAWFLRSLVPRADCRELHLEAADGHRGPAAGAPVVLLEPFDRPVPSEPPGRLRCVSRRAWMAAFGAALLARREPGSLCAAARADMDLWPHQLEPALAVVRRDARRLLLADAVGLGKTIEAGLVLAELRARSMLDRALVLAPPGLCDQWCAELTSRFGLDAAVADAGWLRTLRPVLPPGVNPWSIPGVRVASLDFAKRPEVRRSIALVYWDSVIVDEAHLAAGDSERRAAAHALAAASRFVILITATPHSGDPRTFHALCGIGALTAGEPVFMFRRSREDAGLSGTRRVHLRRVESSAAERAVRRALDDYIRTVWARRGGAGGRDARLAMIVLLKRSLSGMGPLRRSLATRLERLGIPPHPEGAQLPLKWDAEEADAAPAAMLGAPGLDDEREERRVLGALAESAARAEAHDSKRRALARFLGRVREPAIVFTEYRDTLEAVHAAAGPEAAILHGGMDRFERAEALNRFNGGGARLLLATDAAGEGLNLQQRCRLVINLEMPWNPMRLEQRIGRVDRIGQRRTVHVINLLASGTAESDILARLAQRLDRARRSVGAIDDVLGQSDESVMAACLGLDGQAASGAAGVASARAGLQPRGLRQLDLRTAACETAAALETRRQLARTVRSRRGAGLQKRPASRSGGVLVAAVRRSRLRWAPCSTGLLVVFAVRSETDGLSSSVDLIPVFAEGACPRLCHRRDIRKWAAGAMNALVPLMAASVPAPTAQRASDVESALTAPSSGGIQPPHAGDEGGPGREARLAARRGARRAVQRGLFDRRAEREADTDEAEGRFGAEAAPRGAPTQKAQPVLLLFVTS